MGQVNPGDKITAQDHNDLDTAVTAMDLTVQEVNNKMQYVEPNAKKAVNAVGVEKDEDSHWQLQLSMNDPDFNSSTNLDMFKQDTVKEARKGVLSSVNIANINGTWNLVGAYADDPLGPGLSVDLTDFVDAIVAQAKA